MEAVCALFNAYRNDWGPDATPNIYQLRETAMQCTTTFLTDRLPNTCPQAAPISPNVFSDGSVDHPKFPRWAHPTAALVLPAGEEGVVPDIPEDTTNDRDLIQYLGLPDGCPLCEEDEAELRARTNRQFIVPPPVYVPIPRWDDNQIPRGVRPDHEDLV